MKKKTKQILAIAAVVLLAGLYIATRVLSLMKSEMAQSLFRGAVACTILIPCLLYVYMMAYKMLRGKGNDDKISGIDTENEKKEIKENKKQQDKQGAKNK